jgi:hypothetical protein
MANKYACVLDQPEDKVDVDISVSFYICPKSIWPQCIRPFAHFPIGGENFAFVQVSL